MENDTEIQRDKRLDVMITQYEQLRNEIIQSIRFQNRIVLGEAVIVALISGLQVATLLKVRATSSLNLIIQLAAFVLPPVIIVSTALWAAEQSRMMRIGNYLSLLENKVNEELNTVCLSWENWLRSGGVSFVGGVHHTAKTVGYLGFFCLLGALGLLLYVKNLLLAGPLNLRGWFELAFFVVYVSMFLFVLLLTVPIIDYRQDTKVAKFAERLPSGQQWSLSMFSDELNEWGDDHQEYVAWEQRYERKVLYPETIAIQKVLYPETAAMFYSQEDVQTQLDDIVSDEQIRRGS